MSDLTVEKMDKINFLITEVSLECLGNKFFDIYGKQMNSLLGLISASSMRPRPDSQDWESDLWKSLTVEKRKLPAKRVKPVEPEPVEISQKKRRASVSAPKNENDTTDEPESLLIPMATPKAAKITNRRSTISVQSAKLQLKNKGKLPSTAEIKQSLRRDINIRYNAMRLLSESQEEKYRTLNINPNMGDFYKAEEKSLFSQCNTLIQFIKFIQENGDNPSKLAHISQAILDIQKEY